MKKFETIYDFLGKEDEQNNAIVLYREPIGCDCNLVVFYNQIYIEYDFSKYGKGSSHEYHVPLEEIDEHLEALKANLRIYKNTSKTGSKYPVSYVGLRNMFLCINTRNPGVCIEKYYFPVANDEDYKKYETAFKKAQLRGFELLAEISAYKQEESL